MGRGSFGRERCVGSAAATVLSVGPWDTSHVESPYDRAANYRMRVGSTTRRTATRVAGPCTCGPHRDESRAAYVVLLGYRHRSAMGQRGHSGRRALQM